MTTQSHDSKNSNTPSEAPATWLDIPLSVSASKHQPLLTAFALANANQPQRSSPTHSPHQHVTTTVPSGSHHSNRKPDLRQHSILLHYDCSNVNVHYDNIMQNL